MATGGWELWKSDGTVAGTSLVEDFPFDTSFGLQINGAGTLPLDDSPAGSLTTNFVSPSLGSSNSTTVNKNSTIIIGGGGRTASPIASMVNVNGTLYFTTDSGGSGGIGLWKTDGTAVGTTLVQAYFTGGQLERGPEAI